MRLRYVPNHPSDEDDMVLGRRRRRPTITLEPQPDGLPKSGLFAEPVRVEHIRCLDPEQLDDDRWRITFMIEVRDAEKGRCPDISVEARVTGPERSATAQATTDMLGRIRFRTSGPPGTYRIEVLDVAAGGLAWDADGGPIREEIDVG